MLGSNDRTLGNGEYRPTHLRTEVSVTAVDLGGGRGECGRHKVTGSSVKADSRLHPLQLPRVTRPGQTPGFLHLVAPGLHRIATPLSNYKKSLA